MKLTGPQRKELDRCAKEPQNTFGSARTRTQNTLVRLGLAVYIYPKRANGSVDELCEITDAGREAIKETS